MSYINRRFEEDNGSAVVGLFILIGMIATLYTVVRLGIWIVNLIF